MKAATRTVTTVVLEQEPARREKREKRERPDDALDRVLEKIAPTVAPKPVEKTRPLADPLAPPLAAAQAASQAAPQVAPRAAPPIPMLRTARIVSMAPGKVEIAFRGTPRSLPAQLGEGVERELVALAMKNRDVVLVEWAADATPIVVGVVQTRTPSEVVIKAQKITIDAEQELTLRSGTAAMRLREDGDVEVVGSRIAIASRGLFRLVGRMLRLN